jgi:hypothetical protein
MPKKWINSSTAGPDDLTVFNYIQDENIKGSIFVDDNDVKWFAGDDKGPADTGGHAKRAVETLTKRSD